MSSCSLLLCLFALVLQVYGQNHRQFMEECKAKLNFNPREAAPNSPEKKCFMACLMKASGVMNADNTFNSEKENERIDKMFSSRSADEIQKIKSFAQQCGSQSYSGSECDIAGEYHQCQVTKAKQAGLDIKPKGPPPGH